MGPQSGFKNMALILAVFLAVIIGIFYLGRDDAPAPTPTASTGEASEAEPVVELETPSVPDDTIEQDVVENTAQPTQAEEPTDVVKVEEDPEPTPTPLLPPQFDLVRVEQDGTSLISGQVSYAGTVYLLAQGERVPNAQTEMDGPGDFVLFATLPMQGQPQTLEIEQVLPDGTVLTSEQRVFIAPVQAPELVAENTPVSTNEETPPGPVTSDTDIAITENAPADEGEAAEPDTTVAAATPKVLLVEGDDVRVLASPVANVAVDTIRYDLQGDVIVGGRAAGDGFVRIYLDDTAITTSQIEDGGFWRTDLPDVKTGIYTLRIDELNAEGDVISRAETPFQRESPAILETLLTPGSAADMKEMTVQPGTTLWGMAIAKYGDGMQFMKVFEANKDTISDPDLIYPGQVFDLPD